MTLCIVGKKAPLFKVDAVFPNGKDGIVSLAQNMKNNLWTVVIFYPKDFTKICPTEITAISDRYDEFEELECMVVAMSTDCIETHKKWIATPRDENGVGYLNFPLASDMNGFVSRLYNVYNEEEQVSLRGLFIINPEGELQYITVFHDNIGRDVDETLRVLQALQTGGLCPANWRPGDELL